MGSLVCPCCCCCCYSRAAVRRLHWAAFSSQRGCVWQLTQFPVVCKERPGMNRISHPDWVKLRCRIKFALQAKIRNSPSLHRNTISFFLSFFVSFFLFFLSFLSFLSLIYFFVSFVLSFLFLSFFLSFLSFTSSSFRGSGCRWIVVGIVGSSEFHIWLDLVGWGCRIHRLLHCRGVRLPQRISWYDTKTIWRWGSSNVGALGDTDYSFIAIAPRSTRQVLPW